MWNKSLPSMAGRIVCMEGRTVVSLRCGLVFIATCKATQVILRYISNVFTMLKHEAHLHSAKTVQGFLLNLWFTSQKGSFFLSSSQPEVSLSLRFDIVCILQRIWTVAGNAEPDPKWPAQGACLANLMEMYNHILMPDIHYFVVFFFFFFLFRSFSRNTKKGTETAPWRAEVVFCLVNRKLGVQMHRLAVLNLFYCTSTIASDFSFQILHTPKLLLFSEGDYLTVCLYS